MVIDDLRSRRKWARFFSGVIAFAVLILSSAAPASAGENSLAGAWIVTIVFDDPSLVGCTTFGLDTEDGGIVNLGCDVSESPGYGQWKLIGLREFAVTFVGANFGAAGTGINSTYKVRATVRLSKDGKTSSGPFVAEIFALDGTMLFSATGTVHRKRVEIEPL